MNTDKNTALYEKMAVEQDKFRDWLKSQPPEEILNHAYEYTVREDILMAMEELDLTSAGPGTFGFSYPAGGRVPLFWETGNWVHGYNPG